MGQLHAAAGPEPASLQAWATETLDTGADTVLAAAAGHAHPDPTPPDPRGAVAVLESASTSGGQRLATATRGRTATPIAQTGRGAGDGAIRNGRSAARPAASAIPHRPSSSDSLELSPPRGLSALSRPHSAQVLHSTAKIQRRWAGPGSPGRAVGEARVGANSRIGRPGARRVDGPKSEPLRRDSTPTAIPSPRLRDATRASEDDPLAPSRPREGPAVVSGEFPGGALPAAPRSTGADMPATAALRAVCAALDSVPSGVLLCGRYQMLGRHERRFGGAPTSPLFCVSQRPALPPAPGPAVQCARVGVRSTPHAGQVSFCFSFSVSAAGAIVRCPCAHGPVDTPHACTRCGTLQDTPLGCAGVRVSTPGLLLGERSHTPSWTPNPAPHR